MIKMNACSKPYHAYFTTVARRELSRVVVRHRGPDARVGRAGRSTLTTSPPHRTHQHTVHTLGRG